MSVANGRQLAPGVAEQLVRRAVGTTERGADETKQAAQLLGPFPTVVHRGLEVVVLDLLERRDGPFDLLVGDAANGVGHLLLAVEGISHTGPLPGATPGNPEALSACARMAVRGRVPRPARCRGGATPSAHCDARLARDHNPRSP